MLDPSREPASPSPVAAGAFSTWNSLAGQPILAPANMRHGDEVDGDVTIKNMGDMKGRFTLLKLPVVDPDARSGWLHVGVHDITPPGPAVPVYEGTLAAMPAATQLAGEFAPNEQRHYRFRVRFEPPSAPAAGHPTATTSVAFEWGADPVTPAATPPPAPPTPPAAPAPPPAAAPAPAPTPAPAARAPAPAPRRARRRRPRARRAKPRHASRSSEPRRS